MMSCFPWQADKMSSTMTSSVIWTLYKSLPHSLVNYINYTLEIQIYVRFCLTENHTPLSVFSLSPHCLLFFRLTIFSLIERFYEPDEGAIQYGQQPIRDLDLQGWRQKIAYVWNQAPYSVYYQQGSYFCKQPFLYLSHISPPHHVDYYGMDRPGD